jgi:hypothetical protein
MLTYILSEAAIVFEDKGDIVFPSNIQLFIELEPEVLFGIKNGFTRACFTGSGSEVLIDFERGTQGCRNILKPQDFQCQFTCPEVVSNDGKNTFKEYNLNISGNILTIANHCESKKDFGFLAYIARYLAPASLCLELWEPVSVKQITGMCGKRPFKIQMKHYGNLLPIIRPGDVEKRIHRAFENLKSLRYIQSPRLKAALHYYHTARRLIAVGENVWEFVPEVILNYSKILEVLFGDNRDGIKQQLVSLGIEKQQIEGCFIPIMLLRSHFDIAHVRLSKPQNLNVPEVAKFIVLIESQLGNLIQTVIQKSESGTYMILPAEPSPEYTKTEQSEWDTINQSIRRSFFGESSIV